ncbi:hypothetical protein OESDEN_23403 [Oesophagostomum dentatum]|uniref:Uncharacterized protein n=1 Tax=Oesophagostomum dentatum TaxID=61180 RepID=A0A0B1S0G5_OESDE|nr:hypothetical protein OESDEN_23403 [Oesophagostomum dentatum]
MCWIVRMPYSSCSPTPICAELPGLIVSVDRKCSRLANQEVIHGTGPTFPPLVSTFSNASAVN